MSPSPTLRLTFTQVVSVISNSGITPDDLKTLRYMIDEFLMDEIKEPRHTRMATPAAGEK